MRGRSALGAWGLSALLAALACGQAERPEADAQVAVPISGRYDVKGGTVDIEGGHRREIAGQVVLTETGGAYTATFHLNTTYPGAEEALPAEVIGKGEGTVEGRTLRGSAETQLVMATVPGVDPGFAYVPRMVSTRIQSTTMATVANDGTVSIEIENRPAPGEDYAPTKTTLKGRRVSGAGVAQK
jgi:hypothetical protein